MADLDPLTDEFTSEDMKIGFLGDLSKQYLNKLAANTSYLYNVMDRNIILWNEFFGIATELDYDTDKDYVDKYIKVEWIINTGGNGIRLPWLFDLRSFYDISTHTVSQITPLAFAEVAYRLYPKIYKLSTTYQFIYPGIKIKALATGGFRLYIDGIAGLSLFTFTIVLLNHSVGEIYEQALSATWGSIKVAE